MPFSIEPMSPLEPQATTPLPSSSRRTSRAASSMRLIKMVLSPPTQGFHLQSQITTESTVILDTRGSSTLDVAVAAERERGDLSHNGACREARHPHLGQDDPSRLLLDLVHSDLPNHHYPCRLRHCRRQHCLAREYRLQYPRQTRLAIGMCEYLPIWKSKISQ